jgi:hypothetical protein
LTEIQGLCKTYSTQFSSNRFCCGFGRIGPLGDNSVEENRYSLPIRGWESKSHLEAAPDCPVQQLGMVGSGDHYDVTR